MLLFNSKALLSQWKPHDAAVNFDTYWNLQQHHTVLPAIARHLVSLVILCCINIYTTYDVIFDVVKQAVWCVQCIVPSLFSHWSPSRLFSTMNTLLSLIFVNECIFFWCDRWWRFFVFRRSAWHYCGSNEGTCNIWANSISIQVFMNPSVWLLVLFVWELLSLRCPCRKDENHIS